MKRTKSTEFTVYLTPEESAIFTEYARQWNISKSELLVRSTNFCIAHTNESGAFVAPQFTVDKVVERLVTAAVEKAKKDGVLVLDSIGVKQFDQN